MRFYDLLYIFLMVIIIGFLGWLILPNNPMDYQTWSLEDPITIIFGLIWIFAILKV